MIFLVGMVALVISVPGAQAQAVLPTPTALDDGRIFYIAEGGDSWWIISVKMNVAEDTLYKLNNATSNDPIVAGQKILIGIVTATLVPTEEVVTPTPNILTPAVKGYGEICVVLFNDANGNSTLDSDEARLPNGAVSLVDRSGQVNKTGQTTASEDPLCFIDLPEGEYNLSVAVPDGYNATTSMNAPISLVAGDRSTLNFGAQNSGAADNTSNNTGQGTNTMVAILGGVLILSGIGLGIYFLRSRP